MLAKTITSYVIKASSSGKLILQRNHITLCISLITQLPYVSLLKIAAAKCYAELISRIGDRIMKKKKSNLTVSS